MGVRGAIANKMEASQETCFGGTKITQASLQIIKWYVPYILNLLKALLEKLERNNIDISDFFKKAPVSVPSVFFLL